MLRDLLTYLRAPYPWHLVPMGYVREGRLIAQRAKAMGPDWSAHLAATRKIIEESAALCPRQGRVVVVGSGNLLDVPLEALCRTFDQVDLLDIHHPSATRAAVRGTPARLITEDITGVVRPVFEAARRHDDRLPESQPPEIGPTDLIVSVNLLSQLAVIPCDFLRGHRPEIHAARLSAFARGLIEAHLRWLTQSAAQTCLITDVSRTERSGSEVTRKDILEGVPLPVPDAVWDWRIDAHKGREVLHRVQAYRNFQLEGRGPDLT